MDLATKRPYACDHIANLETRPLLAELLVVKNRVLC